MARDPFSDPSLRAGVTDLTTPLPTSPSQGASAAPTAPATPRRAADEDLKVYPVGGRMVSILDLLALFAEGDRQAGGLSRLADLHLKVGQQARYRHDGKLVPLEGSGKATPDMMRGLIYPLLRPDQIARLEDTPPEDVDAAYQYDKIGMDFRINVFHDSDGLAMVIRALSRDAPGVEDLGFPDPQVIESILKMRQGLVIVTGITGSGKSTTIASILSELNRREQARIITLEDPVEYVLRPEQCLISQREIGRDCRTFSGGLRSALREDPDIIFLGEIRDTETANLALSAAETGHLVFSTLHTRDAKGVITRLVDLFPPERSKEVMSQVSFSLGYVIAQKLLPRADGQGRVASFEVMRNSSSVGNLIRTGSWHQLYATIQLSAKEGMITMEKHLMHLVSQGVITPETAVVYANDASQLASAHGEKSVRKKPRL